MTRVLALVLALAAPAAAAEPAAVRAAKKKWSKLDAPTRVQTLKDLSAHQSKALLSACERWYGDKDLSVRAQVFRLVAGHVVDAAFRAKAEAMLTAFVATHMKERARRSRSEFNAVCRKHGRKIPPGDQMTAGRNWKDPYDEKVRQLPAEIRAERAFMIELIGALEAVKSKPLGTPLMKIFREHHDPEVLVRVVQAFGKRKEWQALPHMANVARIQKFGRMMGGADVIGEKNYETARLKWDVHKDRLWWSRPEYVPRVSRPIRKAASTITGESFVSIKELDRWLLDNEPRLRAHGVKLTATFRRRAAESQR